MSASDQRQKVEWTQGVLVCIRVSRVTNYLVFTF